MLDGDAAGRHLVLHVPGAQLHHRCLSRHAARAPRAWWTWRPSSRSSRNWWPARSSAPRTCCREVEGDATLLARRRPLGPAADGVGLLQEAGDCRQRRPGRRQGLRARGAGLRDPVGGRLRLRDPDLRGLLGLQRHRARHGALVRLRADGQLRPSVSGARARRTSGAAGTSRSPPGSATTSTSRSAARARASAASWRTSWRRSCSRASGTARAGTTSCGASITACCWWRAASAAACSGDAAPGTGMARLRAAADRRHVRAGVHRLADVPRDRHHDAAARPHAVAGRRARRSSARPATRCACACCRTRCRSSCRACGWRLRRDRAEPSWPAIVDGLLVGLLFAAILVFRSQASLDFIYFQF